jgi:dCTP diphosphatase
MSDTTTSIHKLKTAVKEFNQARQWGPYNTPKNLAMAIAVEAAELMELFTWLTAEESSASLKDQEKRTAISHEIADIAILLLGFCDRMGIDLSEEIERKLEINARKYPLKDQT